MPLTVPDPASGPRVAAFPGFCVRILLMMLVLTGWPTVASARSPQDLAPGGVATVKEVLSGDTVVLEDGRILRLGGIQAPKMNPSRGRGRKAPLADEARAALTRLALNRKVSLHYGAARLDRHERVLAQLVRDDGLWLQKSMVEQGWARVYALHDTLIPELLAVEAPVREARHGIWQNPAYAVRTPDGLGHDYDSFQVVEGLVLSATLNHGLLYLNFGPDWRTDFTIKVPRRVMRAFTHVFGDPLLFKNRVIRVRGWIYRHNGPEMELSFTDQIELIGSAPDPASVPAPTPTPAEPMRSAPDK